MVDLRYLQLESINPDNIWKPPEQIVFLRGVAGIGKSTLINKYVLKWAEGKILKGETGDGKIDFLFFFDCRRLNTTPNLSTLDDLFKEHYGDIFKYIDIPDLQSIADRVMIIVDGLDKLQGIYNEDTRKSSPVTELVKKVINAKYSVLKNHKIIACGRSNACEAIKSRLINLPKVKTVEISGFSEENTINYIGHFFLNDTKKSDQVKRMVKQKNIRVMTSVPAFLEIICSLCSEELEGEIKSSTELYTYWLLILLKNYPQSENILRGFNLSRLVNDKKLGEFVYSLARWKLETYMNHKVAEEDINNTDCSIHLEQTGFIVKHSVGEFGRDVYQFRQLNIHEFLCSLYLCLTKDITNINYHQLSSCIPTILVIHHLAKERSNKLFSIFYQNMADLINNGDRNNKLFSIFYQKMVDLNENKSSKHQTNLSETSDAVQKEEQFQSFIKDNSNVIKLIEQLSKGTYKIYLRSNNFAFIRMLLRENDRLVDERLLKAVKKYEIIVHSNSSYDSAEVLELLNSLKITRINELNLLEKKEKFSGEDSDLMKMVGKNRVITIQIDNSVGSCFKISSRSYGTKLVTDMLEKYTLASVLKESNERFFIRVDSLPIDEDVLVDNIFCFVGDLIEHVLDHEEQKVLKLQYLGENANLIEMIEKTFSQRKYYENILL